MAIYLIRSEFQSITGLPKDITTSNFKFQTTEGDPSEPVGLALIGHVAAAYHQASAGGSTLASFMSPEVSRVQLPVGKAYEGDGVGPMGSPIATAQWAGLAAPLAAAPGLPAEVACCVSFMKDYGTVPEEAADGADAGAAPDRPRSRMRGRYYFGPIVGGGNAAVGNPCRPSAALIEQLLTFADFLATPTNATLTAVGAELGVDGKDGFKRYDRAWVDDAFDTQRRRGVSRGARYFRVI